MVGSRGNGSHAGRFVNTKIGAEFIRKNQPVPLITSEIQRAMELAMAAGCDVDNASALVTSDPMRFDELLANCSA